MFYRYEMTTKERTSGVFPLLCFYSIYHDAANLIVKNSIVVVQYYHVLYMQISLL